MSDPAVTVVTAAYGRPGYLRQALISALAQTFTDFELVVRDDSASAEIAALVAELGDPRLRYQCQRPPLGIARNHFDGYQSAHGRYITTLDDDDLWEPEFLARMVPPLEADADLTLAFCDHHLIDGEGHRMADQTEANSHLFGRPHLAPGRQDHFLELAAVRQAIPFAMASVFRRARLDGLEFPKRVGGNYDFWMAYAMASRGGAAYYVPERLTSYRIHPGSGTATRGIRNLRESIYTRRRMLGNPALAPYRAELTNNLGIHLGKLALLFARPGTQRRARRLVVLALRRMNRPKNMAGLLKNYLARRLQKRAT